MDDALKKWVKSLDGMTEFDGVKITSEPSISQTEKWRYWRCGLEDKSAISVNIQTKTGGEKSSLAINRDNIQEAGDLDKWRKYWKTFAITPPPTPKGGQSKLSQKVAFRIKAIYISLRKETFLCEFNPFHS